MTKATNRDVTTNGASDQITFVEIANAVLRKWRLVLVLPLLFAFAAAAYTITRPREYAATATFMPQSSDPRGAGGAAALAEQFGVNLMMNRPGQSPQFYVDLLRSKTLLKQVVETDYAITQEGRPWRGNLIAYYEAEGGRVPPWREALDELNENIVTNVSRETGVIEVAVLTENRALSEQVATRLLGLLNDFNLQVRQSVAQEESRFINSRIAEARPELQAAEDRLEAFLRRNREFRNSPDLSFQHDRLERDVVMRQDVYTSLLRSLEQARIDAVRDIPAFAIIDHPEGTGEPQGRGTVVRTILAFIAGLILAVLAAFVAEYSRRNRVAGDPEYLEFRGLALQAWQDIRHPARWVRVKKGVHAGDN